MKPKGKLESKIPTTNFNTNTKRPPEGTATPKRMEASVFKKNEFTLIILGALVLTLIVFFLFFRGSGTQDAPMANAPAAVEDQGFEDRIARLEAAVQGLESPVLPAGDPSAAAVPDRDQIDARLTRLETAFSVKFDSAVDRITKLEKSIAQLKGAMNAGQSSAAAPVKKITPEKKAIKKDKKAPIFHTVEKGETLYSISKKYKTSVAALQKLNNLSPTAKIYPGNNILVR